MFTPVPEILDALRAGRCVLVVDDEDRENEGDVICAAEHATLENVNFMATHARGLICMPMSREWTARLGLPQMVSQNTEKLQTAFTVSIDHGDTTTGISAAERAYTARKVVEDGARPEDFRRPGHMFPLEAREGGVIRRAGHTEATVDLMRLAGLKPVGLCCEIMKDDGTMARLPDVEAFSAKHGLPLCSIADLIAYRTRTESLVERVELQATGQWLFEGRRVSLRPDILCECGNGRRVVLDTKWKRVYGPKDLSVADMHQMYAYGQRYRAEGEEMQHVILLYPWHEGVQPGMMPEGRHVSSDGVQVDMFFFDLSNAATSVSSLLQAIEALVGYEE